MDELQIGSLTQLFDEFIARHAGQRVASQLWHIVSQQAELRVGLADQFVNTLSVGYVNNCSVEVVSSPPSKFALPFALSQ